MKFYGYENTLTKLQKGKMENAMKKLIRCENKVMTKNEFIIALYKKGYIPTIHKSFGRIAQCENGTFVDGLLKCQFDFLVYLFENKIQVD